MLVILILFKNQQHQVAQSVITNEEFLGRILIKYIL